MAYSVVDSRTVFTANDSVGGWDEATTSAYSTADFGGREGSGFVGFDIDIETLHNFEVDVVIPTSLGSYHYGGWLRVTNGGQLDTKANGGIRLCLRDTSGNESYFYVGGSDTYAGGWAYFVCNLGGTPNANNGANANVNACLDLGVGGKCLAKSGDDNFQMDLMHYGLGGLTVTGTPDTGTYGADRSMEEIYTIIDTNNLGGISKQAGSYVFRLPLTLDTTTFSDNDSIMFFEDLPVSTTFYKMNLLATQANTIAFNGLINKTEGTTGAELDFSTALTSFSFDACTSIKEGLTNLQSGSYSGNKYVSCGGIGANTGAFLDAFIVNISGAITLNGTATLSNSEVFKSTSLAGVWADDLASLTGNTFTCSDAGNHAVNLGVVASTSGVTWLNTGIGYASVDGQVGDETILVSVSSGFTLTINVGTGANTPTIKNTGLGTVIVVENQVTLQVEVLDDATGLGIDIAHIMMLKASDKSEIMSGATNASGIYSELFTYATDIPFVGWARQWDIIGEDYTPKDISGTITSAGSSITVRLKKI